MPRCIRCRVFLILLLILVGVVPSQAALITKILANAPDYAWWYGCAPTAAGMLMGYYDINGYGGLNYDNLVPGGTAELETFSGQGWSALANKAIASQGHVADFYKTPPGYGGSGDDNPPPWHSFNSLADFMGTSQDSVGNTNGSTKFYYWSHGAPFTWQDAKTQGVWNEDGMYGIKEYVEYAGYGVDSLYTQLRWGKAQYGCTFDTFMAEINAGRPALLHVTGHSMFAYGYAWDDQTNQQTVYIHDTWTPGPHTMSWGGYYSGLEHWGMTFFTPTGGTQPPPPPPIPEAGTLLMFGFALALLLAGQRWGIQKN